MRLVLIFCLALGFAPPVGASGNVEKPEQCGDGAGEQDPGAQGACGAQAR